MGIYSDYIDLKMDFSSLSKERKKQLAKISEIRKRDILVYASDPIKKAPTQIFPPDLIPFKDQISNIKGDSLDIILETPGGIAETVDDMVNLVRSRFEKLGIIVPGTAKSAGTIFTMAGDEILMGETSALGPIDAQVMNNGKRFSADAFLDGLEKIKREVATTKKLNPTYIPILQNISPGEIQHCENAQNFSKKLVTEWLSKYKFKYWEIHASTKNEVTKKEKEIRANQIASKLCKHSDWLTHGRSIRIVDLEKMKLKVTNYEQNKDLSEAINRYYALLQITFSYTAIYKIFETKNSQIYQSVNIENFINPNNKITNVEKNEFGIVNIPCPQCKKQNKIQVNFVKVVELQKDCFLYPKDNIFVCPNCGFKQNLLPLKLHIEAKEKRKIII